MPQPLKYKKSVQAHRKEGAKPDLTAKNRMRAWRKKRRDALKQADRQFDRLYRFIGIHDYELAKAAWRKAMIEIHPDHGGDPASAARVNEAWGKYKKQEGWTHVS
jgi:hypothetical protein